MSDFRAKFKAAKAQRAAAVPTKDQIRALKAQRAATAAASAASQRAEQQQAAPRQSAQQAPAAPPERGSMPPPPPRRPAADAPAAKQLPAAAQQGPSVAAENGLHASSQNTRIGAAAGEADTRSDAHGGGNPARSGSVTSSQIPSGPSLEPPSALPVGLVDHPEQAAESVSGALTDAPEAPMSEVDVGPAADLPPDFFEQAGAATPAQPQQQAAADGGRILDGGTGGEEDKPGQLPKGFFADKDAGAKAAGQKVEKPKAPTEQYADFMKAIAGDVREVDRREEEEASEAAAEREEREAFEQRLRIQQIEDLRRRKRGPAAGSAGGVSSSGSAADGSASRHGANGVGGEQPAAKRRRVVDVLAADSESEDDSEDDEIGLDWRAKGLQ